METLVVEGKQRQLTDAMRNSRQSEALPPLMLWSNNDVVNKTMLLSSVVIFRDAPLGQCILSHFYFTVTFCKAKHQMIDIKL